MHLPKNKRDSVLDDRNNVVILDQQSNRDLFSFNQERGEGIKNISMSNNLTKNMHLSSISNPLRSTFHPSSVISSVIDK